MIDKRTLLALTGGGALALLLPGRGWAAADLRFATPFNFSLSFSAVFYAKAAGYFQREGLDVDILDGKSASLAAQLVIASQVDIARTGGANYITSRVNSNAPLISIATIAQTSPFSMVLPPGSGTGPESLKGKTIGVVSLGSSMESSLNLMLRAAKVDPASVNRVKVADVPASYGLIQAKRIDGFMASISTLVKIRAAEPDAVAYAVDDGLPGQVYVASPAAIQGNEEQYVGFLRAVHRSASDILDAPDPKAILTAIAFVADIPGIKDSDTAVLDLKQNAQTWVAKGRQNLLRNVPEQWASAVQVMSETQMINASVDPTALYTNALLDKALVDHD